MDKNVTNVDDIHTKYDELILLIMLIVLINEGISMTRGNTLPPEIILEKLYTGYVWNLYIVFVSKLYTFFSKSYTQLSVSYTHLSECYRHYVL